MNNNILLIILLLLLLLFDNYTYSVKTKPNRNHHEYPNRDHSGMSIGVNIGKFCINIKYKYYNFYYIIILYK